MSDLINTTSYIPRCLTWFNAHVDHYEKLAGADAFLVQRKQRHTMRVLEHAREILKESGATPELSAAIEIATILHDVGRFPQILKQGSFDDKAGLNHAEAGAKIIIESRLLEPLSTDMREVIINAVQYHNLATIPKDLKPEALLALEVLRDADKLDAIRNNLKYLNPDAPHGKVLKSGLTWHPDNYTEDALNRALERKLVPFRTIKWSNDYILFLCCWIYDLHFTYSFMHLKESGNFDDLLSRLPTEGPLLKVKEQLKTDLDRLTAKNRP